MAHQANLAASLGSWSARHRTSAIVGWLLLVIVAMLIGSAVGQVTMTQAEYGAGESGQAQWLLTNAGVAQPAQELVLVHSATTTASGSGFQAAVRAVITDIQATGRVQDVRAPAVSPGRHDVLIQFAMKGDPNTAADRVQPVLDAVARARTAHPDVTVEQFGDASANKWFNDTITKDLQRAEWTVVPLALGILLVVFGAVVAALLPVMLALTAFLAANGLLALISHALHVDSSTSSVMLLMGMAVGVDYCLFYLRREREERARGRDPRTALRIAAATSGRSVLISGLTVIVAMAGMFLAGMQLFAGFAVATILVVLIAMAGSVTVLPALLSLLGDKVEFGRIPFLGRVRKPAGGSRAWKIVLDRVLARPGISAALAAGALLALASPVISIHTEKLSVKQQLPASTPIVQTYQHIMAAFPGGPAPALVVVKAPDIRSAAARQGIAALAGWHSPAIGQPVEVTVYPAANLAEIQIPLAGTGADAGSQHALSHAARHDRARHRREDPRRLRHWSAAASRIQRLQQPAATRHRAGLPVRHGHHVHRDAGRVQLDHDRRDHDRAQPAVGRRRVRGDGRGLPARLGRRADRHHGARAPSSPGSRCSSSSCCSACPWTTTCSWCRGSRKRTTTGCRPSRPSRTASAPPPAW